MSIDFSKLVLFFVLALLVTNCKTDQSTDNQNNQDTSEAVEDNTTKTTAGNTEITESKATCFTSGETSIDFLKKKAQAIHDANIKYNSEPLSDCSGMYFRMVNSCKEQCPDFTYPKEGQSRSSRDLANYYNQAGSLTIIKDARNASQHLKPGMAVFFGQSGKDYTNFDIDYLTTKETGIEHIGLIVEVEEKNGVVESFQMFHGRSGVKPAAITKQYRIYPHDPDKYPPYGNWSQQLVAVAPILPTSELASN